MEAPVLLVVVAGAGAPPAEAGINGHSTNASQRYTPLKQTSYAHRAVEQTGDGNHTFNLARGA